MLAQCTPACRSPSAVTVSHEPLRSRTGDRVYQQVADLLAKIRDCHERLGTPAQFTAYLAMLRADQKRKRNLMKLLDQRGLRSG